MKNLKAILAAVAVVASAGAANAAPPASHTFAFTPQNDIALESTTGIGAGQTINGPVNVQVNPYFYVEGGFGGDWVVDGWGTATSNGTHNSRLDVYHNQAYLTEYSGFADPAPGINLEYNEVCTVPTYSSGWKNAAAFNHSSGGPVTVAASNGHVECNIYQRITVAQNVPAGNYSVTPTVTFTVAP